MLDWLLAVSVEISFLVIFVGIYVLYTLSREMLEELFK